MTDVPHLRMGIAIPAWQRSSQPHGIQRPEIRSLPFWSPRQSALGAYCDLRKHAGPMPRDRSSYHFCASAQRAFLPYRSPDSGQRRRSHVQAAYAQETLPVRVPHFRRHGRPSDALRPCRDQISFARLRNISSLFSPISRRTAPDRIWPTFRTQSHTELTGRRSNFAAGEERALIASRRVRPK